jgi:uncharacterized protein (DUF2252 family)
MVRDAIEFLGPAIFIVFVGCLAHGPIIAVLERRGVSRQSSASLVAVRLHAIRRRMELTYLKAATRRDGNQVRRDLRNELEQLRMRSRRCS